VSQNWTLDSLGNWSELFDNGPTISRSVNAANEIIDISSGLPAPTYDRAGNMTSDGTLNYQYDAWNRLVKVTSDQDWYVNGYIYFAKYGYDGLNRRIEREVYMGSMMAPVNHYYYNQNWQMLEDRLVVGPFGTCGSKEYIWSPRYVDSPIVSFYDDPYQPQYNNTLYYTTDANHNVTATIDAATGDVVNRYAYTAYGKATEYDADWSNPAAPAGDGPLYCGYFFDAETGNYLARNRYYSANLGTFISRDPIGYDAGDMNLYEYTGDSPLTHTDPTGLKLTQEDGCSNPIIVGAILDRANRALLKPSCQKWFKDHGFNGPAGTSPDWSVRCHGKGKAMCWGVPAWTYPGCRIGLCENWLGTMNEPDFASNMIHELAHHYCTWGPGRETCAESAEAACGTLFGLPPKKIPPFPLLPKCPNK
jgi:RHS repeat-associated protein